MTNGDIIDTAVRDSRVKAEAGVEVDITIGNTESKVTMTHPRKEKVQRVSTELQQRKYCWRLNEGGQLCPHLKVQILN